MTSPKNPQQLLSSELHSLQDSSYDLAAHPLLPALTHQSRYWIPLLLSWIRQDSADDNEDAFELLLSLKQCRKQSHPSNCLGRKYVQIESLRALNLLHEWMCEENHNTNNVISKKLPPAASTQQPLSTPMQKHLLRHPSAVPIVISLLSSPNRTVAEQSAWILGSIDSGGLETMSPPGLTCAVPPIPVGAREENDKKDAASSAVAAVARRKKRPRTLTAQDAILAAGMLTALLECLDANRDNLELHRVGVWCLSSLIEGRYSGSESGNDSASSSGERKFYGEEINVPALGQSGCVRWQRVLF